MNETSATKQATWQPPEGMETVFELAKDANSALNGISDAVGLTEKVEQAPYTMIAAALGVGYIIGGGLLTSTSGRLVRLGFRLASLPLIRNRLLDVAESVIDDVLENIRARGENDSEEEEH